MEFLGAVPLALPLPKLREGGGACVYRGVPFWKPRGQRPPEAQGSAPARTPNSRRHRILHGKARFAHFLSQEKSCPISATFDNSDP